MSIVASVKRAIRAVVPAPIFSRALSFYHFSLALLGALYYGYPSRYLSVIGVTGTKGKTSTTELVNAIFEEAGHATALNNSIRTKIGGVSNQNAAGRSMPGRFFLQKFLHDAVKAGCTAAIIEMTSEGARQHRHRFIDLDALVFTNLAPEHIESHGSYEAYADAKFEIGRGLARSRKRPRIVVANADDAESVRYLTLPVEHALPFALSAHAPWSSDENGGHFSFDGGDVAVRMPGEFSLKNALAAAVLARAFNIKPHTIAAALGKVDRIPGRADRVEEGQDFIVVVDYTHTPDSLKALCDAYGARKKICILGSAGGGRDTWKRPVMGKVAEDNCAHVILTNDDPYDENPETIIAAIRAGMRTEPEVIMDRRAAIRRGIELARTGDAVLITGKGIDPITGPGGVKIPWNDAEVAREEIRKLIPAKAVL